MSKASGPKHKDKKKNICNANHKLKHNWMSCLCVEKKSGWKMGKVGLVFTLRKNDSSSSLPTGQRILTSTNRKKSKSSKFVKLSQIYKTATFNDVSFCTPSDPLRGNQSFFFFFFLRFQETLGRQKQHPELVRRQERCWHADRQGILGKATDRKSLTDFDPQGQGWGLGNWKMFPSHTQTIIEFYRK